MSVTKNMALCHKYFKNKTPKEESKLSKQEK